MGTALIQQKHTKEIQHRCNTSPTFLRVNRPVNSGVAISVSIIIDNNHYLNSYPRRRVYHYIQLYKKFIKSFKKINKKR
jgi:hypothetical protein